MAIPEFHQWLEKKTEELQRNEWVQKNAYVEPQKRGFIKQENCGEEDEYDEWGFPLKDHHYIQHATEDFKQYVVYMQREGVYICDCKICGQDMEIAPEYAVAFDYEMTAYCGRSPSCCP